MSKIGASIGASSFRFSYEHWLFKSSSFEEEFIFDVKFMLSWIFMSLGISLPWLL